MPGVGLTGMRDRDTDGGWWWMANEAVDEHLPVIGVAAFAVYAVLCRRANREGCAWPSLSLLADDTGLGRATVKRSIPVLEQAGLLQVERGARKADGSLEANRYRLVGRRRPAGLALGGGLTMSPPVGSPRAGGGLTLTLEQDTENKTQRTKKEPRPSDGRVRPFLERFNALHVEHVGLPYAAQYGKDGKLIAALPAEYSLPVLERALVAFFTVPDAWTKRVGYTVGTFRHRLSSLVAATAGAVVSESSAYDAGVGAKGVA